MKIKITKDQHKFMDTIISDHIGKMRTKEWTKKLDKKTLLELLDIIILTSSAPHDFSELKKNHYFKKIVKLVKKSIKNKKIDRQLSEIYKRRKRVAEKYIDSLIESKRREILGEKILQQISRMRKSNRVNLVVKLTKKLLMIITFSKCGRVKLRRGKKH